MKQGKIWLTGMVMLTGGLVWPDRLWALEYPAMVYEHPQVQVQEAGNVVSLENSRIRVAYDLTQGTFSATDKATGCVVLENAGHSADAFQSRATGAVRTCRLEPLSDLTGMGRSLLITTALPNGGPRLLLRIALYENEPFIVLGGGVENTTAGTLQIKEIRVVNAGTAFKGLPVTTDFQTLDGGGGGLPTSVSSGTACGRSSRNNLLVTFGEGASRHSLVFGGLTYAEFEKYAEANVRKDALEIGLYSKDPVGTRIDPGTRYLVNDWFYLDLLTANPFEALEAYGQHLRVAQEIVLPVCAYPILDTWEAQVVHFGAMTPDGYRTHNDSIGAVEEMECIARTGILKYTPVAVLLEPDLYDLNNQQGWWDDQHWQRGGDYRRKNLYSHPNPTIQTDNMSRLTRRPASGAGPFARWAASR